MYISIAAVTAAYGCALTAPHFFSNAKKSKQKRLTPASGPSLRLGVPSLRHPSVGHRLRLASLHLLSMTAAAPHRATRSPRMNNYAQPPDGACGSRSRSKAAGELTLGLLSRHGGRGGLPADLFIDWSAISCRSEPARDGDVSGDEQAGCAGLIASRLAPTVDLRCMQVLRSTMDIVGASRLRAAFRRKT